MLNEIAPMQVAFYVDKEVQIKLYQILFINNYTYFVFTLSLMTMVTLMFKRCPLKLAFRDNSAE